LPWDALLEDYLELGWLPAGALRPFPEPATELADWVMFLLVIQLGKACLMLQRQEILHKARSPGGELKAFLKILKECRRILSSVARKCR